MSPFKALSKKQLLAPVWQATPFCSTCMSRQSLSQSKAAETTFWVWPLVSPFFQSALRERL